MPNDHHSYHLAFKKIHCADEEGNPVIATANNGYKLEQFIFDVFEVRRHTRHTRHTTAKHDSKYSSFLAARQQVGGL
jgi:UDP-N-acetylglucosamine pyrophosphorylase